MSKNIIKDLEPYSSSLQDFCRFLESRGQQATSPKNIAELWESQAEALRIGHEDVGLEAIDMLLDTMLTTLHHLAEAQEQRRLPNRVKAFFRNRASQSRSHPSRDGDKRLCSI